MSNDLVKRFAANPLLFFSQLQIRTADGMQRFGERMADFQKDKFEAIAPALLAVAEGRKPKIGRYWFEGTKGCSKDGDLAACAIWLLCFARRSISGQVGAGDFDQANELRKSIKNWVSWNPWLASRIEVQSWRVICSATESEAEIISCDAAGSHGARPDFLILNELSHVEKFEFAETLLDNSSKVPGGLVVIATNAGFVGSDAWRWRELARTSLRWFFHVYDRPAPWLDPAELEDARKRNSASRFARLFYGRWCSGNGDAIPEEAIQDAIVSCSKIPTNEIPDWQTVIGLDLGVKRDHSAAVVLGVHPDSPKIRLIECHSWSPPRGGEIDLMQVERVVGSLARRYHARAVWYDPAQAVLMAQRLRRQGIVCREMTFTGANLDLMAVNLMTVFGDRLIEIPHGEKIISDLGRIVIEQRSFGHKLTAVADANGHADTAIALAIGLPAAMQMLSCTTGSSSEIQKLYVPSNASQHGVHIFRVPTKYRIGEHFSVPFQRFPR